MNIIPIFSELVLLSPYTWQNDDGIAEALMPGAYLRIEASGCPDVGLVLDLSLNQGCPSISMPVVEWSVDKGPMRIMQIPVPKDDLTFLLPLADSLTDDTPHIIELHFRAANLCMQRWSNPQTHLRIKAVAIPDTGKLLVPPCRKYNAIIYGDSITEGVGAVKKYTTWEDLSSNRAAASWVAPVCDALNAEYGQLGTGGQGVVISTVSMPALLHSWELYSENCPRLVGGRLSPAPDFIFCAMGTNDNSGDMRHPIDIRDGAFSWLTAVRAASPEAWIFWLVPPLGLHGQEIRDAVAERNSKGDNRVFVVNTDFFKDGFDICEKPSRLADDGIHPNADGIARIAAVTLAVVQTKFSDTITTTKAGE